jgi:hypothetical protein
MPKTTLFETNVTIKPPYLRLKEDITDMYDYIKPGMVFTMKYTHTQNYQNTDNATIKVTVQSVRTCIEACCCCTEEDDDDEYEPIHVQGCVLRTEEPIYICIGAAALGRPIILYDGDVRVANGYVEKILEKMDYKPWDIK